MAKRSLFAIPIVGAAFRMSHYVTVDRGHAESAVASIALAAEKMKKGVSFLIYPEGTRSRDGRLLPFRRGAFALANRRRESPVVPGGVQCGAHHACLAEEFLIAFRPGEIVVRFCPAIDAAEYSLDRRGELAERAHAVDRAALPPDQQPAGVASALDR